MESGLAEALSSIEVYCRAKIQVKIFVVIQKSMKIFTLETIVADGKLCTSIYTGEHLLTWVCLSSWAAYSSSTAGQLLNVQCDNKCSVTALWCNNNVHSRTTHNVTSDGEI